MVTSTAVLILNTVIIFITTVIMLKMTIFEAFALCRGDLRLFSAHLSRSKNVRSKDDHGDDDHDEKHGEVILKVNKLQRR